MNPSTPSNNNHDSNDINMAGDGYGNISHTAEPPTSYLNQRMRDIQTPVLPLFAQPTSARGILRRLAKITAATTKRRPDVSPNLPAQTARRRTLVSTGDNDEDEDDDIKPPPPFSIDESIGENTSETLTIPEVTVLEGDTDEDDEVPALSVLEDEDIARASATRTIRIRSGSPPEHDDYDQTHDVDGSTFMTEHGRRALSDEPTRMSRYSFGSIHMSGFGSELEIRRDSTILPNLDNPIDDIDPDYDGTSMSKGFDLGPETENLRNLQRSPSSSGMSVGGFEVGTPYPHSNDSDHDNFQLELDNELDAFGQAKQRAGVDYQPVQADSILIAQDADSSDAEPVSEENDSDVEETDNDGPAPSPPPVDQTMPVEMSLLETVAAQAQTQALPRKKLKLNHLGNMVPAIPSSLIKKIVHESQDQAGKRKTALGKEHMNALEQASEWFFEQMSQDLVALSAHSRRRKRINTDDALLVMKRQRLCQQSGELEQLAKQWLPRDVVDRLDLPDRP